MTFIVAFWAGVFGGLSRISAFYVVRKLLGKRLTVRFVDGWVLGHLMLAVSASMLAPKLVDWCRPVVVVLAVYGSLRIFEVIVYQINVLLFDEYRAERAGKAYEIEDARRMIVLLLHNFAEIVFWFAVTYIAFSSDFVLKGSEKFLGGKDESIGFVLAVYNSFITTTTFGDYNISPSTNFGAAVILLQSGIGLLMTLISLARFLSALPPPRAKSGRTES